MSRTAWARLDNASNIFLAARTAADPKVFRLSAELDHEVDPVLLQQALDTTYADYPLYRAVLRQGFFWHYLQDSDLQPIVGPDLLPPCAPIYDEHRSGLLFRVIHHRDRVSLEVFHALSDGTGALWFFTDLLVAYARLRRTRAAQSAEAPADAPSTAVPADAAPARNPRERTLSLDAFAQHFRRPRRRDRTAQRASVYSAAFDEAAAASALSVAPDDVPEVAARSRGERSAQLSWLPRTASGAGQRVRGERTPDLRTRVVELSMPASEVIAAAKADGASLQTYLVALFFEGVRRTTPERRRRPELAVSIPVNLRQFFPSDSARNFFATVRVAHRYGEGEEEADRVGAVARQLEEDFRPQITPEALGEKLRGLIRLERTPLLRILPWPVKDLILSVGNALTNRGLTVAISNLGRISLPEPAESMVKRMYLCVSAVRPQFCSVSHAGELTISFTSPFVSTAHVREFARLLTQRGVHMRVAAGRVTEEELDETGPQRESPPRRRRRRGAA